MSTPERAQVEAVFEAALDLPEDERDEFVSRACGTDQDMRRAVLALLAASARPRGLLEADASAIMSPARPPERLGVYRILRELGRGGMGVVYDAERDDGQFRRRVAIKVMTGRDAALQQRVFAERQILAALDHPHIARLLDGGVDDEGRPYIVMEFVDGLPVDVYCDRLRLTVAERLRLFITIARAVDAAHRSLVVHRDLKPSNVLVTPDGTVKLLDFGVAKLLNPWLTSGGAPLTIDRAALTPEYASPEQIRGAPLTTTSDVFSLGVMLYEILTGSRPHARHEHDTAALIQAVCAGAVDRASVRVSVPGGHAAGTGTGSDQALAWDREVADLADARNTTPARLEKQLRGDCDAILAMALRPEPQRRYGSAELLAQDIERHLAGLPVQAQRGSRGYALAKLVRRHRTQAVALVIGAAALLTGTAAALWQASTAHVERVRAEDALAQSEQVTDFLLNLFEGGNPAADVGPRLTAPDLVRRGAQRIDDLSGQPRLQARMLGVLGRIHESLGEYDEGQRLTERGMVVLAGLRATDTREYGELLLQRGILQRRRGEYDSAQATFMHARVLLERTVAPGDALLALTMQQLASIAIYRGDLPEAERRALEALEVHRRALGDNHRLTVNMLQIAGTVHWRRGDYEAAERMLLEAMERRPLAAGSTRAEALNGRLQLANLLQTMRRDADAEAIFRQVHGELRPDVPEDMPFVFWTRGSLGTLAEQAGDMTSAVQLRREILELQESIYGDAHPTVALSRSGLARVLALTGELDEAERLVLSAQQIALQAYGDRSPPYANALVEVARLRAAQGRLLEADSLIARALQLQRGYERHMLYAERLLQRADVQQRLGDYAFAERLLEEALEIGRERVLPASAQMQEIHRAFVQLYTQWNRPADAQRHRDMIR